MTNLKVPALLLETARGLRDVGPPPMVIEELLPAGSITFISGAKYTGKTFFALEAARAVGTSGLFMGKWKVERPGNVLIVEQDSPRYDTGRALWCMLLKQYAEEDEKSRESDGSVIDPIYISWHPDLDLLKRLDAMRVAQTANALYTWRGQRLYTRSTVDTDGNIIEEIEEEDFGYRGASLIILDSARALNRGKENESDDMETFVQNLKYIRGQTGAAVIVIAHDNADGTKTRGSTAIEAGADSEYAITKRKSQRDHGVFVRKARAIAPQEFRYTVTTEEIPGLGFVKEINFKEFIEESIPEDGDEVGAREKLMAFIASGPKELKADLEPWSKTNAVAPTTLKKYLKEAIETGYLVITYRNQGRARFAIYAVKGAM